MKKPFILLLLLIFGVFELRSQTQKKVQVQFEADPFTVGINQTLPIKVKVLDMNNQEIKGGSFNFLNLREEGAVPTSGIQVDEKGMVTGRVPGNYRIVVFYAHPEKGIYNTSFLDTRVNYGALEKAEISNLPAKIYVGSSIPLQWEAKDKNGFTVPGAVLACQISDASLAEVDALNNFYAKKTGKATISLIEKAKETSVLYEKEVEILKNPVESVEIKTNKTQIRTGDVLKFEVLARDKQGAPVNEVPLTFAVNGRGLEKGSGASAIIDAEGRFVAEKPGTYTVIASFGNKSQQKTIKVSARNIQKEIKLVGQGAVRNKHTSDFWVWEGIDGKDYAVTGTWGADGKAYFWHVSNPSDIQLIDSVQVDARTVNDVKISEDGRICVISREGASNRKNGIVIIDVSNPAEAKIVSTYTENLTGGVHNVFIYQNHVYALSNGQHFEIINIKDPKKPYRVGSFELKNPGRAIHDVWVEDGIAYSSNWNDGVIMVDVGNGVAGGSPSNPVEIARARVEGDANHAAFPFKSQSTDKFYIIAGDEIFPTFFFTLPNADRQPFNPKGYLHFMDFSDPKNPKEVARYEVPEAGSHNYWVEGDLLYVAYYNGGLRVVDISGDLMGNLYEQGREIAHFIPKDPKGFVPNHAMTWGAMPHKGHIFMSDFNSGLWAVKMSPINK